MYRPDGSYYSTPYSFALSESRGGYYYATLSLPSGLALGTWHVGIEINGTEMARPAFQVASAGAGAARVTQGSAYVANGRTTPIDFGTVGLNAAAPQQTFTVSNLGNAALNLSSLSLPTGFSLVGTFPASIAAGGSATFTVQMPTASAATRGGILSFATSDPNAPAYQFNVKGVVSGGAAGAVHGQVFQDAGTDGIENGAETGQQGWTVNLLNPSTGAVLATTSTGFNGYYSFLNLAAGSYRVRVTAPTGWYQDTANPADVTVAAANVLASPLGLASDITPPTAGTVGDGSGADIDYQASANSLAANWSGFGDSQSGIASYQWGIGTTRNSPDFRGFAGVGTATSATATGLALQDGTRYYVFVRALDGVGNVSAAAVSDGVAVDAAAPVGSALRLPNFSPNEIPVAWSGTDPGSGVALYDVYASVDGGPWQRWLTATVQTSAIYAGQAGHSYDFYAVATDAVGNVESQSPASEAHTRTPGFVSSLAAVNEDTFSRTGATVSSLLAGHDADLGADYLGGIAVTQTGGQGTWQYSPNGGLSWLGISSASESNARLLSAGYRVRFVPGKDWNGEAEFVFYGWNGSQGKAGTWAVVTGSSAAAFSTTAGVVGQVVLPVNDAPVWSARAASLSRVLAGDPSPSGDAVGALLGGLFRDADAGTPVGAAVVGATGSQYASWQYQPAGSSGWLDLGQPSAAAARLLSAGSRVRFVPAAGFAGSA